MFTRVSGPINSVTCRYNDVEYVFLGDLHFSTEHRCRLCAPPECFLVTDFLDYIFTRSKVNIDFYLEIPFIVKNYPYPSSNPRRSGFIDLIADKYWNEFIGISHRFSRVKFHYIDVRVQTIPEPRIVTPDLILSEKLVPRAIRRPRDDYVRMVDRVIERFYGDFDASLKLFKLALTSDNYIDEARALLFDVPEIIVYALIDPTLVKSSRHVIRKQLVGVEPSMRNKIVLFMMKNAEELLDKKKIKMIWNSYYYRSGSSGETLINVLIPFVSLYLDAYLLSRMFRFDGKLKIAYVGLAHVSIYQKFFEEELGVKCIVEPVHVDEKGKIQRCTKVILPDSVLGK